MSEERLVCPACQSSSMLKSLELVDHEYNLDVRVHYQQCADCLSFFQKPMPDVKTLSTFYPDDYHSFDPNNLITHIKHSLRLRSTLFLMKSKAFSMLDYGCGGGSFLKFAAQKLPESRFFGYEIDNKKEVTHHEGNRVKIIRGSFDDLIGELPNVDLISMHHVIEHLPDPFAVIKALFEKLNHKGFFIGQTPASDSLEYKIFKHQWSGFHAPRHTVIFSKKGIAALLERVGFNKSKVTGAFNPGGIAVSLATLGQGHHKGRIVRGGFKWLFFVALATLVYPIDLLSSKPGIMNFQGQK